MLFKGKNNKFDIDIFITAACDCAYQIDKKGIVNIEKNPDIFFLYTIGVMRCSAADAIAYRHPDLGQLPDIFRIGNSSRTQVPDMLVDELKYLLCLSKDHSLKHDPDYICLLLCYVTYFNSIAVNPSCQRLEKKLFRRAERYCMELTDFTAMLFASSLWFSDKNDFKQQFISKYQTIKTELNAPK